MSAAFYIDLGVFLLISTLLSSVGLGGGAFYVPLLLALGYSFQVSSSISLFLITVTGFSAFARFQRANLVDWKLAVVMDTFTDIGAFVGGVTAIHIKTGILKIAFALLLVIAAFFMFKMQKRSKTTHVLRSGFGYWQRQFGDYHYSIFLPAIFPITFAIGYLSGALGVAGGLLKIPIMILWFGVPAKIAVATSSLMVGLTGLLGFGGHFFTGQINWMMSLGLGIIVLVGGQIGSRLSIRLPEQKLKTMIAVVFVLIALWMILKALQV